MWFALGQGGWRAMHIQPRGLESDAYSAKGVGELCIFSQGGWRAMHIYLYLYYEDISITRRNVYHLRCIYIHVWVNLCTYWSSGFEATLVGGGGISIVWTSRWRLAVEPSSGFLDQVCDGGPLRWACIFFYNLSLSIGWCWRNLPPD